MLFLALRFLATLQGARVVPNLGIGAKTEPAIDPLAHLCWGENRDPVACPVPDKMALPQKWCPAIGEETTSIRKYDRDPIFRDKDVFHWLLFPLLYLVFRSPMSSPLLALFSFWRDRCTQRRHAPHAIRNHHACIAFTNALRRTFL